MFSRQITMQIKKNWTPEFPKVIEKEVLPLLRRQKGFLDELILLAPNKTEVVAISLWENKEFAEIYDREFCPEAVKIINKYVEGLPVVKTFEVEYARLPVLSVSFVKARTEATCGFAGKSNGPPGSLRTGCTPPLSLLLMRSTMARAQRHRCDPGC